MGYALITGGTRGIGLSVARILAKRGYSLLLTYGSDADHARAVCQTLLAEGASSVEVYEIDQTHLSAARTLADQLTPYVNDIDVIVFNAGVTLREPFGTINEDHWLSTFNANVHFPVFLLQRLITTLHRGCSIIFTGSLMGIHPHGTSLSYGVTKAATHALVKNLVKFLAPAGIRVNGVAPGFVDTDWQKNKPVHIRNSIENKVSLSRFAQPSEIAQAYTFLIDNTYVNGEIIVLDGGYSYQ